jgi:hypothetical protein
MFSENINNYPEKQKRELKKKLLNHFNKDNEIYKKYKNKNIDGIELNNIKDFKTIYDFKKYFNTLEKGDLKADDVYNKLIKINNTIKQEEEKKKTEKIKDKEKNKMNKEIKKLARIKNDNDKDKVETENVITYNTKKLNDEERFKTEQDYVNKLLIKDIKKNMEENKRLKEQIPDDVKVEIDINEIKKIKKNRNSLYEKNKDADAVKKNNEINKLFKNVDDDFLELKQKTIFYENNYNEYDFNEDTDKINNSVKVNLIPFFKYYKANEIIQILIDKIINQFKGYNALIGVNGVYYTLNDDTINRLIEYINGDINMKDEREIHYSDAEILEMLKITDEIEISLFKKYHKNKKNNGAFFKYINKTNIDLSRYGIYKKIDKKNYEDNCLFLALKNGGLDDNKLEELKIFIKNRNVPSCDFNKIVDKLEINMIIKKDDNKRGTKYNNYGDIFKENGVFNIGLLENHYFINEDTEYTSYSIKNYYELTNKNVKDLNEIIGINNKGYYKRDVKRFIDSYDLIKLMLTENREKNGAYFQEITNNEQAILGTNFYDKVDDKITNLYYKVNLYNVRPVYEVMYKINEENKHNIPYDIQPDEIDLINKKYDFDRRFLKDYDKDDEYNYEEEENEDDYEKKLKTNENTIITFNDFETYADDNGKHIAYSSVMELEKSDEKIRFYGEECGKKLLDYLITLKEREGGKIIDFILYFHNAKYDYNFLINYIYQIREIENNNRLIASKFKYKNYNFIIKDSYLIIPMPLRDFSEAFNIKNYNGEEEEINKEVMPYSLYNKTRIDKRYIDVNECLDYVKKENKNEVQFLGNVKKWKILKNEKIDILEYSLKYCEIDVYLLKNGFITFKRWIKDYFDIDILNINTISSLSTIYLKNKGCYDNTYEIGGKPLQFIFKCCVGGKTMVKDNMMIKVDEKETIYKKNERTIIKQVMINNILNDFDGVSLYPSSMYRMEGFLRGIPREIKKKYGKITYDDIKKYDGFFIEIIIKKVNIKRDFSLMSYKDKNGVRNWSNDMENKTIYVDKITLQDLIEYQDIEYEIIRGYYYNSGFNNKINEVMLYLHNKRKDLKKEGNKAELIFKLISNSAYGQNLIKPKETFTRIFDKEKEYKIFLSRNYNWIKQVIKLENNKYKVYILKSLNDSFNRCHIGS